MTKAPISLQELRRRIYRKAKSDKTHRFWGLFVHVAKTETLLEAYRQAKRNDGASGIDGQTFADVEAAGLAETLSGEGEFTVGSKSPKTTAKFASFRFPASAIAWCRGR